MLFTQIIAFKGYLDNLGKPLNSTLKNCNNLQHLSLFEKQKGEFTQSKAVHRMPSFPHSLS